MNPLDNTAPEFPNENHFFNLTGFIRTFTEEPSYAPKTVSQQIVLVTAGGSTSAYIYDTNATAWLSVNLT